MLCFLDRHYHPVGLVGEVGSKSRGWGFEGDMEVVVLCYILGVLYIYYLLTVREISKVLVNLLAS